MNDEHQNSITEAIELATGYGWFIVDKATTGSIYLEKPGKQHRLRIAHHKRRIKSKYKRNRQTSINVSDLFWREKLVQFLEAQP